VVPLKKWCWKFREDRERLWFSVLTVRYGEEEGRIKDGGRFSFVGEIYPIFVKGQV
jgi:hypothetical protein